MVGKPIDLELGFVPVLPSISKHPAPLNTYITVLCECRLDTRRCLAQPLEAVYHAIVEPLIEANADVNETLLIVVDSLHECSLETPNSGSASDSIVNAPLAELVSQMSSILPNW